MIRFAGFDRGIQVSLDGCGHVTAVDQDPHFEVPVEGRAGEVGAGQEDISTVGYDRYCLQACNRSSTMSEVRRIGASGEPDPAQTISMTG